MNEGIDVTQWLPRSVKAEYPLRFDRGELKANERSILCATPFAFDDLFRKPESNPVLNASHLSSGEFFASLWEVATRKTGYTKMRELLAVRSGLDDAVMANPDTLLLLISNHMVKWQHAMVERLCTRELRTNDLGTLERPGWIIQNRHRVIESFDALATAIEKSLEILEKRLDPNS